MKSLISVREVEMNGVKVNAVDARELWVGLGSRKDFSAWVKNKVLNNTFFEEGVDWVPLPNTWVGQPHTPQPKTQNKKDYTLSLDTAKRVAMSERTATGERVRTYFIAIQKKAEDLLGALKVVDFVEDTNGLVFTKQDSVYTTSLVVAEEFGRTERDILYVIDQYVLKAADSPALLKFNQSNFTTVKYMHKTNGLTRAVELTEQGFMLIASIFKGIEAAETTVKFLDAFHTLREALRNRAKAEVVRGLYPQVPLKRNFVYVLSNSDNTYLKIGVSADVETRIKQLQTGSWATLVLEYKSRICSNSFDIESSVHRILKHSRVMGEWFDVDLSEAITLIENENHQLRTPLLQSYYMDCAKPLFKVDPMS